MKQSKIQHFPRRFNRLNFMLGVCQDQIFRDNRNLDQFFGIFVPSWLCPMVIDHLLASLHGYKAIAST
jgi:hypothetical protein